MRGIFFFAARFGGCPEGDCSAERFIAVKVESLCSRVVACLPSLSLVSASLGSDTGQVSTEYLLYMIITENIDFIQA